MIRKMFALASVTALTGLVSSVAASGCSSTNSVSSTDEGGLTEAGKDATRPKETGPDEEDTGPSTCPTPEPIDATKIAWKPPGVAQGSCSEAEIAALVKFVDDNPTTEYSKLKASVTNATCKACLFVPDGAKWGAFVEKSDGTFLRHNFGGCMAVVSGKESCGKAYSQFDDCLGQACAMCADEATYDKCTGQPAANGACKASLDALLAECTEADETTCGDLSTKYLFEAAAKALCVGFGDGGIGDGGDGG
jgi:hypothetical protein